MTYSAKIKNTNNTKMVLSALKEKGVDFKTTKVKDPEWIKVSSKSKDAFFHVLRECEVM